MTPDFIELDWLARWNQYSPDKVALRDGDSGKEFTYQQCYEKACQLSLFLKEEYGVMRGDRVAAIAQNGVEYVLLFFALQRLGAVLVPLNFRLKVKEWDYILGDCEPKLLFYQREWASEIEKLDEKNLPPMKAVFEDVFNKAQNWPATASSYQARFEDLAMILYTSGTTGFPKGAMITHKMIFWNSVNTSLRLNITEEDKTVTFLPFFHTGGWNVLTTPFLHHGAELTILKRFDSEQVLRLSEETRSTILFGVPTTMDMMTKSEFFEKLSLQSLRYAVVGGEPMPVEHIQTWQEKGIPIRQGYGLTEFGPNVFSLNQADSVRKMGSIGFPNFYIQAKVVDDEGCELKSGEIGELILQGPMCMAGYWRNEKATQETIREGWLHTGDLVRCDDEGYYYVVGRKKEMFISGGENVYPAEIERVLYGFEGVNEVAVIGVSDPQWGEVGKAFISSETTLNEEDIIQYCQSHLAKFKVPKYVEFLKELPKGDSGKILKRQLS